MQDEEDEDVSAVIASSKAVNGSGVVVDGQGFIVVEKVTHVNVETRDQTGSTPLILASLTGINVSYYRTECCLARLSRYALAPVISFGCHR